MDLNSLFIENTVSYLRQRQAIAQAAGDALADRVAIAIQVIDDAPIQLVALLELQLAKLQAAGAPMGEIERIATAIAILNTPLEGG